MKSHKLHFAGGHWLVPITPAENQLKPWRWKKASLVTSPVSSLALACTRSHTRCAQLSSGVDTLQTSSPHAPEVHSESFVSGCTTLSPTQTVNTDGCHPLSAANSCKTSPKLASRSFMASKGHPRRDWRRTRSGMALELWACESLSPSTEVRVSTNPGALSWRHRVDMKQTFGSLKSLFWWIWNLFTSTTQPPRSIQI